MLEDVKNYFANFDGTTNICRTVALWVTIALVIAFITTKVYAAVLERKSKKYSVDDIARTNGIINGAWITVALIVAVAFIVTFSACYFVDVARGEDVLVLILFYPLSVLIVAVVASAITIFVKPIKLVKIICAAVCGAALIAVLVCMIVYYVFGDAGKALSNIGLYISAVIIAAGVAVFAIFADKNYKPFDTRAIAFAAVCVAMSFALSYVRIFKMPMGGSITFASMLPLMLFAFMFGTRKGVLVGAVYGVLQAVQDPWIIHPAQFALDYLVAFASIGLTGCIRGLGLFNGKMRTQFALGAVIACAFRFINHYFAGVFAFGEYGKGFASEYAMPLLANEYFYSFVYQCLYIIPELAIVIAVSMLVFASTTMRRQIDRYSEQNSARKPAETGGTTDNVKLPDDDAFAPQNQKEPVTDDVSETKSDVAIN